MANSDKDIVITPNRGQTADPKIVFSGANTSIGPQDITLNVLPLSNGTLSFEGSAGQLFSIANDLTGTIFSVNDISGIPSIEVNADGTVKLAEFGGNVGIGVSAPVTKLDVEGDIHFRDNALISRYIDSTNIDHIWHDEAANAWNFVSDSTYKAAGNSKLVIAQATATTHAVRADRTITAGSGLSGGGDLTANRTISHADTSTQTSVNNSNGNVIQDVTLDTYGHVTGLASVDLDGRYYTETESDGRFLNLTGGTLTGDLTMSGTGQADLVFRDPNTSNIENGRLWMDGGVGTMRASAINLQTTTTRGSGWATRMFIAGSGNVGIGTIIPEEKVHIVGNLLLNAFSPDIKLKDTRSTTNTTHAITSEGSAGEFIQITAGLDNPQGNEYIVLKPAGARVTISSAGSIGIGGISPGTTLNNGKGIAFGDDDTGIRQNGDGVLEFYANNQEILDLTAAKITALKNVDAPTFNATSLTDGGFQGIATDTAAAPSFTWTTDTNTGIFRNGEGIVGISANGTTSASFSNSGATVFGDLSVRGGQIFFGALGTTSGDYLDYAAQQGITYYENGNATWRLTGNGNNFINGGNLGVGTASPAQKLDVTGSIRASQNLQVGGTCLIGKSGAAATEDGFELRSNYIAIFTNRAGVAGQFRRVSADATLRPLVQFYGGADAATTVGAINVSLTATQFTTSSDYRLKEDFKPIETPVERLMSMKPTNFAWKDGGSRTDGFIAHELSEVVPDAVSGTKDAVDGEGNPIYQGVDASKLVPILTAALQEAFKRIEKLEQQLSGTGA